MCGFTGEYCAWQSTESRITEVLFTLITHVVSFKKFLSKLLHLVNMNTKCTLVNAYALHIIIIIIFFRGARR